MSDKRKQGLIRQLSLQNEPLNPGRPFLKKQNSMEQSEINLQEKNNLPRMIKIAWGENKPPQDLNQIRNKKMQESVEIKKCVEYRRPATAKLRIQKSVDRDSIVYTRQELADRLRKAWTDREEKQNIDIFLNPNQDNDDEIDNKDTSHEDGNKMVLDSLKIIDDSIIHKSILSHENINDFSYVPSNTSTKVRDGSVNLSVNVPDYREPTKSFDEEPKPEEKEPPKSLKLIKQQSLTIENDKEIIIDKPKPSSASSKREMFQKRSNTAFNGSFSAPKPKPQLQRQMSVPVKNEPVKSFASKRRLKVHRKKAREMGEFSDEENTDGNAKPKKKERCKSAPGGEIVTMVSLVSPAGSDVEDAVEKKPEIKVKVPEKPILHMDKNEHKNLSLKKTAKQVSFQQSTIHAIRSFSASFPSRRTAMAAMVKNQMNVDREKRAPIEPILVETQVAKRRHITNDTKDEEKSFEEEELSETEKNQEVPNLTKSDLENIEEKSINPDLKIVNSTSNSEEPKIEEDPDMPQFDTVKEKECWVMYKKMADKGLPVSYNTLLRGLLTPSEYRLTRKDTQIATNEP